MNENITEDSVMSALKQTLSDKKKEYIHKNSTRTTQQKQKRHFAFVFFKQINKLIQAKSQSPSLTSFAKILFYISYFQM